MAEPIGLTIGIAGLAGIFSVCLDVIEKVDSYKDFGIESRSIVAQFEADKILFQKWGKNVGIDKHVLAADHHRNLDDRQTFSGVEKILSSIKELHLSADSTRSSLEPALNLGSQSSLHQYSSEGQSRDQTGMESSSKKKRIAWAFRRKAKFVAQVQQFGVLVQALRNLVPPDGMKGVEKMYNGPVGDGFGSFDGMRYSSL
jgi:hypothetical protein